ncbi:MAG: DUF4097 family beta strand repeat protein [Lachnospiraceae bacterium]|nr:DUF4097 family beta strand repeat protein [Lachnospiraceae bacterium]
MEAIREYLSNLFFNVPETPDVLRAKAELMEMMEDKYEELIKEGKSEEEAIGIVISEFGNLEELAKELGVDINAKQNNLNESKENREADNAMGYQKTGQAEQKLHIETWHHTDVADYINYSWQHAWYIAIGVMLCIWAPFFSVILDGAEAAGYIPSITSIILEPCIIFGFVGMAVVFFCLASSMRKRIGKLKKRSIMLSKEADELLQKKRFHDENKRLVLRITGIFLCIVSTVPSAANVVSSIFLSEILDSSVLFLVGIAVLLLVLSGSVGNRYKELKKAVSGVSTSAENRLTPSQAMSVPGKKIPVAFIIGFVLLAILITVLGLCLTFAYGYSDIKSGSASGKEIAAEENFANTDIKNIKMDMNFSEVSIKFSNTDKVRVEYTGNEAAEPKITESGGTLSISNNRRNYGVWSLFRKGRSKVTVYVPQNRTDMNYNLSLDAGDIVLDGICGSRLEVEMDAGNLEGTSLVFDHAAIEVDAGNAEISQSKIIRLEGDVDAGNFEYGSMEDLSLYSFDLDTDLGNVYVEDEKQSGGAFQKRVSGDYRMQVEVDCGNIEISQD